MFYYLITLISRIAQFFLTQVCKFYCSHPGPDIFFNPAPVLKSKIYISYKDIHHISSPNEPRHGNCQTNRSVSHEQAFQWHNF